MHKHQCPADRHLALCRQQDMLEDFASKLPPASKRSRAELSSTLAQISALSERIRVTTQDSCYELLNVSAGLDGILRLLAVEGMHSATHQSVHCLLSPLKRQLDDALHNVHDML